MERTIIEKSVLETFKSLVAKNLKDKVTLTASFRDELGIDSIQLVSMISVFENTLNFDSLSAISEVDFNVINTGNDIVDLVLKYQK